MTSTDQSVQCSVCGFSEDISNWVNLDGLSQIGRRISGTILILYRASKPDGCFRQSVAHFTGQHNTLEPGGIKWSSPTVPQVNRSLRKYSPSHYFTGGYQPLTSFCTHAHIPGRALDRLHNTAHGLPLASYTGELMALLPLRSSIFFSAHLPDLATPYSKPRNWRTKALGT